MGGLQPISQAIEIGDILPQTKAAVSARVTHRIEHERHGPEDLVACPRHGDGTLGVTGGELGQRLHADGRARVGDEVTHGLALVANQQAAQAAG